MNYKIEELYNIQPVYNISNFEIDKSSSDFGISGTKKGINKETGEVCFFKPFLLREFIAGPLFKSFLGDYTPTQGLAFELNADDTKTFYIYSKSLGNIIDRKELQSRALEASKKEADDNKVLAPNEDLQNTSDSAQNASDSAQNAPDSAQNASDSAQNEDDISAGNNASAGSSEVEKTVSPSSQNNPLLRDFIKADELLERHDLYDIKYEQINGLLKIIVSFLLFNETDGNPANILIGCQQDLEGNSILQSYKIDHGLSLGIPCTALNMKAIYQIALSAFYAVQLSYDDIPFEALAEELSEGCNLLQELSEHNCLKFNEFLNTQFRFLHDEGVFATKEKCIAALKNFKMTHTIGIGKYVELYEEFAEEHLKIFPLMSYSINATPLNKMNPMVEYHAVDKEFFHPFFVAIYDKTDIEGKNPVKWYDENKPEALSQLLQIYEDIRSKKLDATDDQPIMHQDYIINSIDAAILSSGIDIAKYSPSLEKQITPEYQDLLAGCDDLFAKPDECSIVYDASSACNDNNQLPDAEVEPISALGIVTEINDAEILPDPLPLDPLSLLPIVECTEGAML